MTESNHANKVTFGRASADKSQDEGASGQAKGPIVPVSPSQALKPEKVPPPPKRSRRARSQVVIFLNFIMTMMILVAVAGVGLFWYGKTEFEGEGPLEQTTAFMVPEGAGFNQIASSLEQRGIISDQRVFRVAGRTVMGDDTIKAGEYEIKAHASMRQILDLMRDGRSILHSFTIPEGYTTYHIIEKLREEPLLTGDLPQDLPEEGDLLPETYKFSRGAERADILAQMERAQTRALDQIWDRRDPDLPLESKEELVILASIVEKETARADERPRVASVFYNRLAKGMRLQSDPTVIYGIFGGEGKPSDRPIYKSDLEKDTPYNTYTISGLPPAPIANPGRESMEAVANPSRTEDLYFVADGYGGHTFAKTLDEHNANVARWRKLMREQEAKAKADAAGQAEGSQ
ncbi:endolytic transglycosylase MltG [Pseudohoeflea suaedae]|uniref:Endolytic murein transglycosylase n=1 Tax=Pseudohoeflea suaedae TaxID=877384 RepID=A0A4R5PPB0_9HYPH|nr:endolytic transglycosylase MltG [Pseudohoeflea suaedae]TDH38886.1 endolytic transglycosylase MltG [Pseudohoeflea suaedae]